MMEVRDSEAYGKGVFATEAINKWSMFGHVKSEVNVLEDFAVKDHCASCLKDFENLICCPTCSIMRYCSRECTDNDAKYHKYECSWFDNVLSSLSADTKEVNLPSRSQRFLMRFVSHLELSCPSDTAIPNSDLVDNLKEVSQETLNEWKAEVEEIRMILPDFAPRNSIEDLVRFSGIRKSNSFMMRLKDSGDIYGGQLIEIHARINNSCDPNCISSLEGAESFLIALREIKADEEITISYCDTTLPRGVRQNYLKNNLFFDCKCSLCSSDQFKIPEAFRTARICQCSEVIYDLADNCPECGHMIKEVDLESIIREFSPKIDPIDKMINFESCLRKFHDCHWINNKLADMMAHEFCDDPEYTIKLPFLLVNFDTGLIRGSETISNPFVLLIRYEYALALIHRHPELYSKGLVIASNYLKLAARIKGVEDEIAQQFAILSRKWSDYLKIVKEH